MRVALRQRCGAIRVKHQVIATRAQALGLSSEQLSGLVDHSIRAELAHILDLVACSHHANHLEVVQLAQLNQGRA